MIKSHLTAITRKKPSLPMQYLYSKGLLKGDLLDYGCGKGYDSEYYSMDRYDKYFFPKKLNKLYDTITCNYVLNVVSKEEADSIIKDVLSHLKVGGTAYFTVRRDKYIEGITSKGTYQRQVKENLNIEVEFKNKFCIYKINKGVA